MEYPWREKLRRAGEHIQTFDRESIAYTEEANVRLIAERRPAEGSLVIRLAAAGDPPMQLGVIVGDVLHNLRSALDAIAFAVWKNAGAVGKESRVYFPIVMKPVTWAGEVDVKLAGVSDDQRETFRKLQPWYGNEERIAAGDERSLAILMQRPLARLHELARIDRHRIVNPILARPGNTWLGSPEGVTVLAAEAGKWPCKPGDVIVEWKVDPPDAVDRLEIGGGAILVLSEDDALRGRSAACELKSLKNAVDVATRQIEVEVLEVVPPEKLVELQGLHAKLMAAEGELDAFFVEPHVIDHEAQERYARLREDVDAARIRTDELWHELFD